MTNGTGSTPPANDDTAVLMKFNVKLPLKCADTSEVPEDLFPYHSIDPALARKEHTLKFDTPIDNFGRVVHLLNDRMWQDPATEIVKLDTIEIWHFVNTFTFPHAMHLHLVHFEILGEKPFTDADYEKGLKDTVSVTPGEVTSIVMHFKQHTGDYVWHCHVLEHEDHDMMRLLKVIE